MQRLNNLAISVGQEQRDAQIFTCEGNESNFDNNDQNDTMRYSHAN